MTGIFGFKFTVLRFDFTFKISFVKLNSKNFKERLVKLSISRFNSRYHARAGTSVELYELPHKYLPAEVFGGKILRKTIKNW